MAAGSAVHIPGWLFSLCLLLLLIDVAVLPSSRVFEEEPVQNVPDDTLTISCADVANWPKALPAKDQDIQIRGFAAIGLAGILGIDLPRLRNAFYGQTSVRGSTMRCEEQS